MKRSADFLTNRQAKPMARKPLFYLHNALNTR
ncbi:hypothetical protein HDG35_003825 [Paraburkholderia sp. JPY681]|nr:hypothetical protein [Paraburkholderia atlantica]